MGLDQPKTERGTNGSSTSYTGRGCFERVDAWQARGSRDEIVGTGIQLGVAGSSYRATECRAVRTQRRANHVPEWFPDPHAGRTGGFFSSPCPEIQGWNVEGGLVQQLSAQ